MTQATIILGLLANVALLWMIYWRLGDILRAEQRNRIELCKLVKGSLNPRTRIGTLAPQSGATSVEQKLSKLGRASAARRVVVGGDSDSELHKQMNANNPEAVDDE